MTENVFDSVIGNALLIPQGSRLLGRYDSQVAFGQRRVQMVWSRLLMPDGSSIGLERWRIKSGPKHIFPWKRDSIRGLYAASGAQAAIRHDRYQT